MNRKPMPPRKTGLKPSGSPKRGKGLKRSQNGMVRKASLARLKPLQSKATKPKPRREDDMPKAKAQGIVRDRAEGACELRIPGHCLGAGAQFAHRKPEGQGGAYVPSNGLRLCGLGNVNGCHGYQERNRIESYANGWLVKEADDHSLRPVWMWFRDVWGEYLLDDSGDAVLLRTNREEAS